MPNMPSMICDFISRRRVGHTRFFYLAWTSRQHSGEASNLEQANNSPAKLRNVGTRLFAIHFNYSGELSVRRARRTCVHQPRRTRSSPGSGELAPVCAAHINT